MNLLDWIITAIFCFFLLRSFLHGATREIFSILAFLLGGLVSYRYYPFIKTLINPHLNNYLSEGWMQNLVVLFLSFTIVFIIVSITGQLISWILKKIGLGFLDRIMGALIGALKACVLSGCLIVLLTFFPKTENLVRNSRIAGLGLPVITFIIDFLPSSMNSTLKQKTGSLKRD